MNDEELNLGKIADEQKRNGRKRIKLALQKEKEKRSRARKLRFYSGLIFAIILFGFGYWFANNYYLKPENLLPRNPIIKKTITQSIISPLVVDGTVDTLTDMETIEQYRLAPILKSIYMLESTFGQNDGCKDKGAFNGFGYRQNVRENICFKSFAEVTSYVNQNIEERLSQNGNNIIEALCYYNTGNANMKSCSYSDKFLTILVDNL